MIDLCSRILREAPVSTRKFFPESDSGKKSKFELAAAELQAVADGGNIMIGSLRWQGAAGGDLVWGPEATWFAVLRLGAIVVVVPAPVRICGSGTDAVAEAGRPATFTAAGMLRGTAVVTVIRLTFVWRAGPAGKRGGDGGQGGGGGSGVGNQLRSKLGR